MQNPNEYAIKCKNLLPLLSIGTNTFKHRYKHFTVQRMEYHILNLQAIPIEYA